MLQEVRIFRTMKQLRIVQPLAKEQYGLPIEKAVIPQEIAESEVKLALITTV